MDKVEELRLRREAAELDAGNILSESGKSLIVSSVQCKGTNGKSTLGTPPAQYVHFM